MNKQVKVEGMTCNGCANTVKNAFSEINGVQSVEVNLSDQMVTVNAEKDVTSKELQEALVDTNYKVSAL